MLSARSHLRAHDDAWSRREHVISRKGREGARRNGSGVSERLRHHSTRLLLHLICPSDDPARSPLADYKTLRHELTAFDPELARRPEIVAMTQADRPEVREAYESVKEEFKELGIDLRLVSAVTHDGLEALMLDLFQRLETGT